MGAAGSLQAYHRCSLDHILLSTVMHLSTADSSFNYSAMLKDLKSHKVDYAGDVVVTGEDLIYDKILPAWPEPEGAAVVCICDLLDGELWEDVMDPERCLLPRSQWPPCAPRSRVRASDEEWYKICKRALELGLFTICPEEDIFRDQHGNLVLNGAMPVRKPKVVKDPIHGDKTIDLQRFITVMCPVNAYLRRLRGASHTLPFLARMTLAQPTALRPFITDDVHLLPALGNYNS